MSRTFSCIFFFWNSLFSDTGSPNLILCFKRSFSPYCPPLTFGSFFSRWFFSISKFFQFFLSTLLLSFFIFPIIAFIFSISFKFSICYFHLMCCSCFMDTISLLILLRILLMNTLFCPCAFLFSPKLYFLYLVVGDLFRHPSKASLFLAVRVYSGVGRASREDLTAYLLRLFGWRILAINILRSLLLAWSDSPQKNLPDFCLEGISLAAHGVPCRSHNQSLSSVCGFPLSPWPYSALSPSVPCGVGSRIHRIPSLPLHRSKCQSSPGSWGQAVAGWAEKKRAREEGGSNHIFSRVSTIPTIFSFLFTLTFQGMCFHPFLSHPNLRCWGANLIVSWLP